MPLNINIKLYKFYVKKFRFWVPQQFSEMKIPRKISLRRRTKGGDSLAKYGHNAREKVEFKATFINA